MPIPMQMAGKKIPCLISDDNAEPKSAKLVNKCTASISNKQSANLTKTNLTVQNLMATILSQNHMPFYK